MSDGRLLTHFFLSMACYFRGLCQLAMTNVLWVQRFNAILAVYQASTLGILCEITVVLNKCRVVGN
jgi:hypothetical protein